MKPPITTLALAKVALETSDTVAPASAATGEPPPSNVTVPPVVTTGASRSFTVLVTVVLLATPSFTDQLMVRLLSVPPTAGSEPLKL
jgi:hypothetical protein